MIVSRVTDPMMISEGPPYETDALNTPLNMNGMIATIQSPAAPMKIMYLSISLKYSVVGVPGLIPGMKPPCFLRLLDTSIGLNVMDV